MSLPDPGEPLFPWETADSTSKENPASAPASAAPRKPPLLVESLGGVQGARPKSGKRRSSILKVTKPLQVKTFKLLKKKSKVAF